MTYTSRTNRPCELCYNFSQLTLLRWLTFIRGSLSVTLTAQLLWIYLFLLKQVCSKVAFPPLRNSDHIVASDFHWLSFKLKRRCLFSWHRLSLFSSWLGRSWWSFKRCFMGGYFKTWCFFCCYWILWVGLDWNWCIYPSS